jgi:hypothetical protein
VKKVPPISIKPQSHRLKIFGAGKKQGWISTEKDTGCTCRASWQPGQCHAPPGLWAGCRSAAQRERGPGLPSSCPAGAAGGGRGGKPPPDSSDLQRTMGSQRWGRRVRPRMGLIVQKIAGTDVRSPLGKDRGVRCISTVRARRGKGTRKRVCVEEGKKRIER